jgi:glycosyltransferase involved in cell wall biosynthesis
MSHNVNVKRNQLKNKLLFKPKTLCLCMIVKNESKNMTRLLDSVKCIIDYVSIVDTGSTDNTIGVIETWGKTNNVKTKVHQEPFRDFGYNRTHSVIKAKEAFPMADYLLLSDADFVWEVDLKPNGENKRFDKRLLHAHKYMVTQNSDNLSYSNIRILSALVDWTCIGLTHEYWKENTHQTKYKDEIIAATLTSIRIIDLEDGGCKHDKYERDARLLSRGLEDTTIEQSLKIRYTFYLAQTYKCMWRLA